MFGNDKLSKTFKRLQMDFYPRKMYIYTKFANNLRAQRPDMWQGANNGFISSTSPLLMSISDMISSPLLSSNHINIILSATQK